MPLKGITIDLMMTDSGPLSHLNPKGKTHTIFGSSVEPGLWRLATEKLFSGISKDQSKGCHSAEGGPQQLLIQVRA